MLAGREDRNNVSQLYRALGKWETESPERDGLDTARFPPGESLPVNIYARVGAHYGDYDVDETEVHIIVGDGAVSAIESCRQQPRAEGPEAGSQLYGMWGGQAFPTQWVIGGQAVRLNESVFRRR